MSVASGRLGAVHKVAPCVVDELRDNLERRITEPPETEPALPAREPVVQYQMLERGPSLDLPDHGLDMGP